MAVKAAALESLLAHEHIPPVIYLHHPHHPASLLSFPHNPNTVLTLLDLIEFHTARYLYTGILSKFGHKVKLELGAEAGRGEISTWDEFARGLKEIWVKVNHQNKRKSTSSRKRKACDDAAENANGSTTANGSGGEGGSAVPTSLVIVLNHAERLRTVLGGHWPVITRLAELTGVPLTLILCSTVPWDEMRPPRGDALEPINLYIPPPSRQDILETLLPGSSHPLYPRFLDLLISFLLPIIPTPLVEIEYVSGALWPIYTASLPPHLEQIQLNKPYPNPESPPLPLDVTVKLLTDLKHQLAIPLAAATEDLITRQVGRAEFTKSMCVRPGSGQSRGSKPGGGLEGEIPFCAKFLVVAGYCASYNPAKSDLRLFGRGTGPDGKRKRGGGTRRAGYGRTRVGKIPQRLLGPKPFPLDRLLALFASMYAEHAPRPPELEPHFDDGFLSSDDEAEEDQDRWRPTIQQVTLRAERIRKKEEEMEERWEDEVDHLTMSVRLWALIPELEAQGLLRRMSPVDRLDNVMLRCEVDYETVKSVAKDLKITLDEYLYEATS